MGNRSGIVFWRRCWPAVAAGCVALSALPVNAGEAVRFSDGHSAPALPERKPRKSRSLPSSEILERDSSFGGVGTVPFTSVYGNPSVSLSRPRTARERELLDRRSNWIERSPEDVFLNEKTANEAFGVREYTLEDLAGKPKGDLEKAVERAEERARKERTQGDTETGGRNRSAAAKDATTAPGADTLGTAGSPAGVSREPSGLGSSSFGEAGFGRGTARMSDLGRDGPGDPGLRGTLTGLFGAPAQTAPPKWQQTRREEFSRLLGGTVSGGIANPLGGSLDPVNVMPDLTRQEINPVMGRVSSPLANPAQATFSDSLRSVSGPALGRGRGLDLGLPQGFAPASGLNPLAPALEPRRPAASPLVLDIPRRRF